MPPMGKANEIGRRRGEDMVQVRWGHANIA